jgi:hypothetical protein
MEPFDPGQGHAAAGELLNVVWMKTVSRSKKQARPERVSRRAALEVSPSQTFTKGWEGTPFNPEKRT